MKYFPIALIATIESAFRILIAELIDKNKTCLENSEKLLKSYKIEYNSLKALYGKDITLGSFIAHIISVNNLEQINSYITILIEKDFLDELKLHYSRWDVEVKKLPKKPMIDNPNQVYKDISNTFELRHIFAHETATNITLNTEHINNIFQSNVLFLNTASDYINEFIYPNAPLTQTDMNIDSGEKLSELLSKIDKLNLKYKDTLDKDRKIEFEKVEKSWLTFMNKQADFEANEYFGGSIMPTIFNGTASSLSDERIKYLENMVKYTDK